MHSGKRVQTSLKIQGTLSLHTKRQFNSLTSLYDVTPSSQRASLSKLGQKRFIHLGRTLETSIFCKVDGCLSLLKIDGEVDVDNEAHDPQYLFIGRQKTRNGSFLKHRTCLYSRYLLWDCLGGVTREARPFQVPSGGDWSGSFGEYIGINRHQFQKDIGLNIYETSTVENVVDRYTHRLRTNVKLKLSQLQPEDLGATHRLLMNWFDIYNVPTQLDSSKSNHSSFPTLGFVIQTMN